MYIVIILIMCVYFLIGAYVAGAITEPHRDGGLVISLAVIFWPGALLLALIVWAYDKGQNV